MRRPFVPSQFNALLGALAPRAGERRAARRLAAQVTRVLRMGYGACEARAYNDSYLLGAFGKETAVRPLGRIDLLYRPPLGVADRFDRDSARLVADMAAVLAASMPGPSVAADGCAVGVPGGALTVPPGARPRGA